LVTFKKRVVAKFIKSFKYREREGNHGVAYDVYTNDGVQLNSRPILIPRDKDKEFGDKGIEHLADSFGIRQQFLKELLNGNKTIEDYERYIFENRNI
jgi:hypothetical protein